MLPITTQTLENCFGFDKRLLLFLAATFAAYCCYCEPTVAVANPTADDCVKWRDL